jgi:hypothetical protein
VVSLSIVKLTAQFAARKGSQIVRSIDQKLYIGDIVFLGEVMQKRRPQKSEISDERTRGSLSLTPRGQSRGG